MMLCQKWLQPAVRLAKQPLVLSPRPIPLPRTHLQSLTVPRAVNAPYSDAASPAAPPPPPPASVPGGSSSRIFTSYYVYKTRAALCMQLLPPTFSDRGGGRFMEREGVMLLEFANANPGQTGGQQAAGNSNRTYNWGSKVLFALDPNELGSILAADTAISSDKGLIFYHDPSKLGKTGEPMKRLTLRTMQDGNLSFNLNAGPENISVPVTRGEFEVIKTVARYALPYLLGFDKLFAP